MSKLMLTEAQREAVDAIVSEPTHAALVASETGAGKAQPLSELVLTPKGYVSMGDIHVGDYVIGNNGKPTKVLGVFPQGKKEIVRVSFSDNTSVRCTWDHLWTVRERGVGGGTGQLVTKTTRELMGRGLRTDTKFNSHRFFMPLVEPVEFDIAGDNFPLDPYTLGVLLGDGSLTGTPSLNTDIEIKEALVLPEGASFGGNRSHSNADYNGEWNIRGLLPALRELNLRGKSAEKFVPRQYLYSTVDVRRAVLAGLFDTDGSVSKVAVEYGTVSPQLAEDVEFLVRSLGGTAKRTVKQPWYTYLGEKRQGQTFYRLAIRLPENPFRLSRKREALKEATKYPLKKAIDSVEVVGYEEAQCIYVDSPEHLYVTRDFIVTHNTVVSVEALKRLDVNTVLVIIPLNTIDSWKATFANQWPDFPVHTVTAKKPEDFSRLQNGERGAYLIGREFFKIAATDLWHKKQAVVNGKVVEVDDKDRPPKREKRWDYKSINRHLDATVCDEIHFAQNRDSEAFKILRTIRPKRLKIGMSATPGGNKFAGIWAVCRWLWPTTMHEDGTPVVDKSKWRWAATWARVEFDPFAGKKITDEKVPGAFVASLPCYIRDEPPKKPYKRFKVQLDATPEQRRQIAQMEEKSVVWLDEHPLVADLPIVQKIRLRQMTLGEVCFNGDDEIDFDIDCKSAKLDACEKIIARHPGEKILFWTDSRKFSQVAAKRLSKPGRLAAAWTGDENAKKRADLKERFTDPDSDLRFLVVSIAAMAEGVDGMQRVCHTEVWMNRSFNGVHNEQAEGRLNRRGQSADEVVGYFLEMRDTADTEDFARDAKSILTRRKELHHE